MSEWVTGPAVEVIVALDGIRRGDEVMLSGMREVYRVVNTHREKYGTPCDDNKPYELAFGSETSGLWARSLRRVVAWRRPNVG